MVTTGIFPEGKRQQKILPKFNIVTDLLKQRISKVIQYARRMSVYESEISSTDLNAAQCLILALLQALSNKDVVCSLVLIQISESLQHMNSKYLKVWLFNDYVLGRKFVLEALMTFQKLLSQEISQVPQDLYNVFSALAQKFNFTPGCMNRSYSYKKFFSDADNEKSLDNMLCEAVQRNSIGDIFLLVQRGGNVNVKTPWGDSLYHLAVAESCIESINMLGYLKAETEVWDNNWETPLLKAVMADDGEAVRALLSVGANTCCDLKGGNKVIHFAASHSKNEALEVLLNSGLSLSDINHMGDTPLLLAVKGNNIVATKLLLNNGADINNTSKEGESLLHIACRLNSWLLIKELIKAGGKVDVKDNAGLLPLHLCRKRASIKVFHSSGLSLDVKSSSSDSALHLAVSNGYDEAVEALLNFGATVDILNNDNQTPLFLAAKSNIVKMLLRAGANSNAKDKEGLNAVYYAAKHGFLEILHLLLAAGADCKLVSSKDFNILHTAILNGHDHIVEFLLKCEMKDHLKALCKYEGWNYIYNSDVSADKGVIKGPYHWTPLHLAAFKGHLTIVELLLQSNASVEAQDNYKFTPLHLAVYGGHLDIVETLLKHGSKVSTVNDKNQTPFHIAAVRGDLEVMKVLIKSGIDVNKGGCENWTPLHYAAAWGHLEIAKYLIDEGADINCRNSANSTPLNLCPDGKVKDFLLSKGAV